MFSCHVCAGVGRGRYVLGQRDPALRPPLRRVGPFFLAFGHEFGRVMGYRGAVCRAVSQGEES